MDKYVKSFSVDDKHYSELFTCFEAAQGSFGQNVDIYLLYSRCEKINTVYRSISLKNEDLLCLFSHIAKGEGDGEAHAHISSGVQKSPFVCTGEAPAKVPGIVPLHCLHFGLLSRRSCIFTVKCVCVCMRQ